MEFEYDLYELKNELIDNPEDVDIKMALKCIVEEIDRISDYQTFLHECTPLKFKKQFPKQGENPFFTLNEVKGNTELFEAAKERMKNFLQKQEIK